MSLEFRHPNIWRTDENCLRKTFSFFTNKIKCQGICRPNLQYFVSKSINVPICCSSSKSGFYQRWIIYFSHKIVQWRFLQASLLHLMAVEKVESNGWRVTSSQTSAPRTAAGATWHTVISWWFDILRVTNEWVSEGKGDLIHMLRIQV